MCGGTQSGNGLVRAVAERDAVVKAGEQLAEAVREAIPLTNYDTRPQLRAALAAWENR